MKKLLLVVLVLMGLFIPFKVNALNEVNLYFFYNNGCSHCQEEKAYIEALKQRYFNLRVYLYDAQSNEGHNLLEKAKALYNVNEAGVPFTIIGDATFLGFSQSRKCAMEKKIYEYSYNKYANRFGNELVGIGYSDQLEGDVQKQYDDSSYVIEEAEDVSTSTEITSTTNKTSLSKKYSSSVILAGIGVVALVCVLFISFIERKRRFI